MRCDEKRACGKTVKYAGQIARKRKICGSCWYAIMTIARKCLNKQMVVKSHAR